MKFLSFVQWVNDRWASEHGLEPAARQQNRVIAALGLAGETGEVIEHFKKNIRDGKPLVGNNELYLELGDVLHYWVRLCYHAGIDPEEIMAMNKAKLLARDLAKGVSR